MHGSIYPPIQGTENIALHIEPASLKVSPSALLASGFEFDAFDESSDVLRRSGSMDDPSHDILKELLKKHDPANSDAASGGGPRRKKTGNLGAEVEGGFDGPTAGSSWWIKIALSNVVPLTSMRKILTLFNHRDIDVQRMHLDGLEFVQESEQATAPPKSGETGVTMVRMLVSMAQNKEASGPEAMADLVREVKRLKWVDDQTLALAYMPLSSSRINVSQLTS